MNEHLEQHGYAIIPNVLSVDQQQTLVAAVGPLADAGRRGLLAEPEVARLARRPNILNFVRPHLPAEPHPVRAIYFNKTADSNWLVAWHQDLTIAVQEKVEVAGFSPWSVKDGIPHVQPPVELLKNMLSLRVHLDDCGATNGALRVLAGTHRLGKLSAGDIQELRANHTEHLCGVSAGDVLLMRPLLLHASGRSQCVRQRRVLHIEYAGFDLPEGLRWHESA
jgi:ectoine hydroxylase-related dioxygenase (phytanoyl-CoA dioxygenase family)